MVGKTGRRAFETGTRLDKLPLAEFQAIHPVFGEDTMEVFDFNASVARRNAPGGTSPAAVQIQLQQARTFLNSHKVRSSVPSPETPGGGDGS